SRLAFLGKPHVFFWCSTFTQLDPIAVGILLALILKHKEPRLSLWSRSALAATGLMCFVLVGRFAADKVSMLPIVGVFPAVTLGCALLFMASFGLPIKNHTLVYLGRVSYGLYVYHLLAIRL